jgi:ubiquinone/menaquinone biosynthesis C-methylase UbiE
MPDASSTARLLRIVDRLREPAVVSAIESLHLPKASHGLDAGCGIGSHTGLLARAIAPGGHVTGLDACPEHLAIASDTARRSDASGRMSFRQGSVAALPFEPEAFDWVWSVDCVGFLPGDPVRTLEELVRVTKSGGIVALLLWSSQRLLPGYPILEARLDGTSAGIAPATDRSLPERHFMRCLGWFSQAGLRELAARTFAVDVHAPLSEDQRAAVAAIIDMRWGSPRTELRPGDWELFEQLRDRTSPDSIVDRADYFGFFTYTLFRGRVPTRSSA